MPRSPFLIFGAMIALSLATAALVLTMALRQPWLGTELVPGPGGLGVTVQSVDPAGPAAAVAPGTVLISVRPAADGAALPLGPADLIEEPDNLPDIPAMAALFARQGQIVEMLRAGPVVFDTTEAPVELVARADRPLRDLPAVFWIQLVVGLCGAWLGGWVLALRRRLDAAFLALAGLGLDLSAHAAALYSTRELAMPATVFHWASAVNSLGAITFGIGMICLFLVHPVRLVPRWALALPIAVFGTWGLVSFLRLTGSTAMAVHLPVLCEMIAIALCSAAQFRATRGRPHERAVLRWFGLSVLIGAGGFVGLIVGPLALGYPPAVSQGHAFASFLVIYVGLAIGVSRYRLFEIEDWAFRLLFYAGGVALLLLLDAALVYAVALAAVPAFSLALIVVAFVYLPARDWIMRKLTGRRQIGIGELFDLVSDAALAAPGEDQRQRLHALLTEIYQPLEIGPAGHEVSEPVILDGGGTMELPGFDRIGPTRMCWARHGRRLFTPRDLQRAEAMMQVLRQVVERRRAYESGAAEERRRINRDMHDNIGVQLLGALHSPARERKDALIRQTLTDLREIISNNEYAGRPLADLLADLRAEITEHLEAAQIALDWKADEIGGPVAAPEAGTLRAILREAAGNVMHHSGAKRAEVRIVLRHDGGRRRLILRVRDDGTGPVTTEAPARQGRGLINLRQRTEARGGRFAFGSRSDGPGSELIAEVVLDDPAVAPDLSAPVAPPTRLEA